MINEKQCRFCQHAQCQRRSVKVQTVLVWMCKRRESARKIVNASENICEGIFYRAKPGEHVAMALA